MKIYKYEVPAMPADTTEFTVRMPLSKVIAIRPQRSLFGSGLMLWCEVDPEGELLDRTFRWVPTGGDVPENHSYLGTFEFEMGLMFHLYREVIAVQDETEIIYT